MNSVSAGRDGSSFAAHRPRSGYFRNGTKTRELFHDDWLDTSDRGYMAGGDIFITGRIKDIIIRAGRHLYPRRSKKPLPTCPAFTRAASPCLGCPIARRVRNGSS